ncbi:MAG: HipA domain-containing protein, partial [Bacteroidetes bacterium]|nr:HipA domain-containing protein [Bacteroidota bacterium]
FCLRLAKLLNINAPHAEIRWLDNTPYFLIERYDRIKNDNTIIKRIHQEDFCQALGIPPKFRYEHEGGPNIKQSFELLQNHSLKPASDSLSFIQRIVFNYIISN